MDGLTFYARFYEHRRYDVQNDAEAVQLMATTSIGTWHCEVPVSTAAKLREHREAFRTYVLQSMALGQPAHEVCMDG